MTDRPDPPIRKTVSLPASLWQRIEDFQFEHRVKRDTEAVRKLIEIGLRAAQGEPTQSPSEATQRPVDDSYRDIKYRDVQHSLSPEEPEQAKQETNKPKGAT